VWSLTLSLECLKIGNYWNEIDLEIKFLQGPQKVKVGSSNKVVTAKNIIIATGSVPFVPKGIEVDGTYQCFPFLILVLLNSVLFRLAFPLQ